MLADYPVGQLKHYSVYTAPSYRSENLEGFSGCCCPPLKVTRTIKVFIRCPNLKELSVRNVFFKYPITALCGNIGGSSFEI